MKKALTIILKVMWKLVPWALVARGMYLWIGFILNRMRIVSEADSLWDAAGQKGFIDMELQEIGRLQNRVRLGWKWALKH